MLLPGLTCDSNGRRYCVLRCWFFSQKCKKISFAACGDIFEENSALEINIEGMISENLGG